MAYTDSQPHPLDPGLGQYDSSRRIGDAVIPMWDAYKARLLRRQHLLEARMAEMLGVPHPAEYDSD